MAQNPSDDLPSVVPYLLYEDVDTALDWLVGAFGFNERVRMVGPDGKANHAEMTLGTDVVMMGHPGPDYQNPKHREAVTQEIYVYVDDVDGHHDRAKAHGAEIRRALADQFYGDRTYAATDPEGHLWSFAERVPGVAPKD
jgi:PhnB protein